MDGLLVVEHDRALVGTPDEGVGRLPLPERRNFAWHFKLVGWLSGSDDREDRRDAREKQFSRHLG